jgi:CRISPR system Cascade subunit CasA
MADLHFSSVITLSPTTDLGLLSIPTIDKERSPWTPFDHFSNQCSPFAMHSLLDPIFTVDGSLKSLPEILHELSTGTIGEFDYLRRYQKRAWHLFLVQTAAMIGPDDLEDWGPGQWEEILATYGREMWELDTEPNKPAFMQPPLDSVDSREGVAENWEEVPTPDEAGVLSTAAGHTVKDTVITEPRLEHWIYALITTQTTANRKGRGNCRVIRMKSAYNDRPYVSIVPDLDWESRFRSDVETARNAPDHGDIKFLWKIPYNEPVTLQDCHTLFIEICRRFRFHNGKLYKKADSIRMRSAKKKKGAVGDPWIPVEVTGKNKEAFSTPRSGFTYTTVQGLLAGENYETPSLQVRTEEPMYFVAETLGGAKGGTSGFHERVVHIPAKATKLLKERRDIFTERSRARIQMASNVKKDALRHALKVLKEIDLSDNEGYKKLQKWESSYESAIDRVFFEDLWESVDQDQTEAQREWKKRVVGFAEDELERAKSTVSDTRKWKLWPKAQSIFYSKVQDL